MTELAFADHLFDADLVVFDKDGTLIDFHRLWAGKSVAGVERLTQAIGAGASLRRDLYQTLGYDPQTGRFASQGPVITASMNVLYVIATTVLYQHGYGWLDAHLLVEQHMASGMAEAFGPQMLQPLADLPALFGSLNAVGVRLAVVTSDDHAPAQRTLEHFDVIDSVGVVIGADDAYPHKPAPDALLAVCTAFGVTPARAVMVGDSSTDMLMGQRAGFGLCVGVASGPMDRSVLDATAHIVIDSIAQIHTVKST